MVIILCIIVQNASPAVLRIKCKSYVQTQKGIERLYSVKANIESTLTQMTLQKGSHCSHFLSLAQIIQALAVKKGTASLEMMNKYLFMLLLTFSKMSAKEMMGIVHNYQREMEKVQSAFVDNSLVRLHVFVDRRSLQYDG